MQMLCQVSAAFSDVTCPVCGQGFMVYWTQEAGKSRRELREGVLAGLRQQHGAVASADAHAPAFNLPGRAVPATNPQPAAVSIPALIGVYS